MSILKTIQAEAKTAGATLVAVSKTKPIEKILELYELGQRDFGENRVQELVQKHEVLPKDIKWHMIGHLQKNKVKYIAPFVHMIHAVDSADLLSTIHKQALRNERVIDVLLQIRIAKEETKFGLDTSDTAALAHQAQDLDQVNIRGVMGMATFTDDMEQVRAEFKTLKSNFDFLKQDFFDTKENFTEISMGMSGDYKIALEEGSTLIRIGSLLFGSR